MVFDLVQSIEKLQKMTKTELSECLNADLRRFVHKPTLKDRILHNEVWYIYHLSAIFVMWSIIKIRKS